jgi:hypothetical protein
MNLVNSVKRISTVGAFAKSHGGAAAAAAPPCRGEKLPEKSRLDVGAKEPDF